MLYLIQNLSTNEIKIGYSSDPQKRLKQLQTGSGGRLKVIRAYYLDNEKVWEKRLHRMLWQSKRRGEWFKFEPLEEYLRFIDELFNQD